MGGPQRRKSTANTVPRTWRDRLLHALPRYTGPFSVGYMEIEVPAREPRSFSRIKRNHQHALRFDTALFSVYYPADLSRPVRNGAGEETKPPRVGWLPRPRAKLCKGYAKFFSIPHMPVTAYIAATSMLTRMPAFRNARLGRPIQGPEDGTPKDRPRPFPCIVFSHGLGGSRNACSSVCGELASYGFVVVATEHRDGSCARTFVNLAEPRDGESSYMVDYIFPKDNAQDTSPNAAKGVDLELRTAQVEMRLAEIEEALHVLQMVNQGKGDEVARLNLRRKGNVGSSSHGLDEIVWSEWRGRLALENITMMGHSFGGVTTAQVLRLTDRFSMVGQGVLLDAWGPAIPECRSNVSKPLLAIASEAFFHWQENHERVLELATESTEAGALSWMLTVRGSTHLSWTDFAALYATAMSLAFKTLVEPGRALRLTLATTLEFLGRVLPRESQGFAQLEDRILESAAAVSLDDISRAHRPDDKWIAARLKIEHEFSLRASLWLRRQLARARHGASGKSSPGLTAVEAEGDIEEIWMHLQPHTAIKAKGHGDTTCG